MVFDAISTIFQLYRGGQFYWRRKPEYPEKTTDMPRVIDKFVLHEVVSSKCQTNIKYLLMIFAVV